MSGFLPFLGFVAGVLSGFQIVVRSRYAASPFVGPVEFRHSKATPPGRSEVIQAGMFLQVLSHPARQCLPFPVRRYIQLRDEIKSKIEYSSILSWFHPQNIDVSLPQTAPFPKVEIVHFGDKQLKIMDTADQG